MGTRGFEECSRNKNGTRGSIGYTLGGSSRKCVTSALQSPISRSESRGNLSGNSGTSGEPHKQESILTWNGTPFLDRKQHVSASAINGCTCATTLTTSQSTPISMFLGHRASGPVYSCRWWADRCLQGDQCKARYQYPLWGCMCGNTAQKRNKKEEKKKQTKEKRIKNTVKKATSQKNGKKETATQWSKQERGNSHVTKFGQKETATQRSKKERGASHVTRTDLKTKSLGRFLLLCLLALPGAAAATSRTNSTSALEKQFRPGPLGPHGTRPLGVLSHGVVGSWNGNALAAESSPLTAPLQLAADAEQMWCSPVSDYDEPWASIARVVEFLGCSVSNNPHKWLLSFLIWLGCTIKVGQFFDPPKGFRRRLLIGCRFVGRQRKKHVRWKITSRKKLRHRSKFHLKSRTHDIPVAMFRRNNCCDSLWPDMSPQYLNFLKSDRLVGGGYSKKNPWIANGARATKLLKVTLLMLTPVMSLLC